TPPGSACRARPSPASPPPRTTPRALSPSSRSASPSGRAADSDGPLDDVDVDQELSESVDQGPLPHLVEGHPLGLGRVVTCHRFDRIEGGDGEVEHHEVVTVIDQLDPAEHVAAEALDPGLLHQLAQHRL